MYRKFFILVLFCFLMNGLAQKKMITFEDFFTMKRIGAPAISPDGKLAVFTVRSFSIEENKGQNDLWMVNLSDNTLVQLTDTPFSESLPVFSPNGEKIAFLSSENGRNEIFTLDLKTHSRVLAATIPTDVSWFDWSPDNTGFIFTVEFPAEGKDFQERLQILNEREKNPVKAHVADKLFYRSWNHWRDNLYSQIYFYRFQDGKIETMVAGNFNTPPLDLGSDQDIAMSKDGRYLYYVANKSAQPAINTNNDIFRLDLKTGETVNLTKTNEANDNMVLPSPDGKYLLYRAMSRPGFEADKYDLILLDLRNNVSTNLTRNLDLTISQAAWGPDAKFIYFTAPYHGRERFYRIDLKGKISLLDEGHTLGSFAITPDGKYAIFQRQSAVQPTELFRFDLKNRSWQQMTFFNKEKLDRLEMNPVEEFWVEGAFGDSVHVFMVKPPFFDPAKQYPLIVLIHGGPQGAFGDDFHFRWNLQMFAAPGYVVIAPNFHGSVGYGQKFCDAVSRDWGGAPYEDIIKATRHAVEKFSFIDGKRIGAAGASYGGFMIDWIEGHNPDLFTCLISHAGVFDQRSMYGATEELWFPEWEFGGTPYHQPQLYEKYSPSYYATNFKTPCLVIAGEKDFRVPYTQSLQFFTALQRMGVESRLIVFPDEDHFVQKPRNAQFWWKNIYEWFERYLKSE